MSSSPRSKKNSISCLSSGNQKPITITYVKICTQYQHFHKGHIHNQHLQQGAHNESRIQKVQRVERENKHRKESAELQNPKAQEQLHLTKKKKSTMKDYPQKQAQRAPYMPPTKPPKLSHEIMNQSTLCSITRPWTSKPRPTVPKQSKKVKAQGQKKMPLKSQENIISEYQISLKSKMEHRDHKEYRGDKELKGDRDQGLRPKKSIQAKNGDEILKCQERIGFWGHRGKLSNALQNKTKKDFKTLLLEFEKKTPKIVEQEESACLEYLELREKNCLKFTKYEQKLHHLDPQINWLKRAITLNWMIQLLCELRSKREVFHLAACYVDFYLVLTQHIKLDKLQLLACAALSLANKMQGPTFMLQSLCLEDCFTSQMIVEYENKILTQLGWRLHPPTANMWANRISQHWDDYTEAHMLPLSLAESIQSLKFRCQDSSSYVNLRSLYQYIDLCILDIHSLRYRTREVSASFLYLILITKLGVYSIKQVVQNFPVSSQYLLEQSEINLYFDQFLRESFGFGLKDLLPTIQFCSTFLILPLNYELPNGIDENVEIQYSQLCSLLTWNQENLFAVKQRNRNYD